MGQALRVARYRFRATFARRWGGYLSIVVLIGLVGGLAMGAIAGARRTQSSFPAYLRRTNASDLTIGNAIYDPPASNTAYDAATVAKIARLPHVKEVGNDTGVDPNVVLLGPLRMRIAPGQTPPLISGSLDGENRTLDRVTVTSGRLADPKRRGEVMMSASAAKELGMHIGSVLPVGFFTNAQLYQLPGCCSANGKGKLAPHVKVDLELVGIVVLNTELLEDDVDALGDNPVLLTPALMRELVGCCSFYTNTSIKIDGGRRNVASVVDEIGRAVPKLKTSGALSSQLLTSVAEAKTERAIQPESTALGVFGAIAAFATLLLAAQLIGRQLRLGSEERAALRALGASPTTTVADSLLGALGAVALGALLAGAVAVALSPLAPLGPVGRVEGSSIALDWTVLGVGVAGFFVVLSAIAVAIGYRQAPHRVSSSRGARPEARATRAPKLAARAGLPAPAVTGIRFALEPGAGKSAVPVRSAIIGTVLAMLIVTSTVTFGASLNRMVSHPALYGWNWNYELLSGFSGQEDLPQKQVANLLDHDPYVSDWAGIYFSSAFIDGRSEQIIGARPRATVAPPMLSGHGLNARNEIVLGATTLAELHKHVGDTVVVNAGQKRPATLRIVGTATMPTIGNGSLHTTMGTGALLDYELIPAHDRNLQRSPVAGPQAVLIRTRKTASPTTALRSLQQINTTLNTPKGGGGDHASGVVGVLRPAEIVNYRSMGKTPALLGVALGIAAIAALALTLITSVRRRRRELALLKTLGLTRRQLAAVVAWQSTIAVVIGVVIGAPLGVIIGRSLWISFAGSIHAVPRPAIPTMTIAFIALGALVLANLVAAVPGLQAARTKTAVLLRAE